MIWTTTPWTLPANLAVAVHPHFQYALVEIDRGDLVLAEALAEQVLGVKGVERTGSRRRSKARSSSDWHYRNPLCPTAPVEGDLSTVSSPPTTSRSRTAPASCTPRPGTVPRTTSDRTQRGPAHLLPRARRRHVRRDRPDWLRGVSVWDANDMVVEHLRETGHLFHDEMFTHSYPHDWRSKTPVIFRATEQWFVAVDRTTKRDGEEPARARDGRRRRTRPVHPRVGTQSDARHARVRPDWCISRQRVLGPAHPRLPHARGHACL
jgi:isoleucyl-tRNA synthetase